MRSAGARARGRHGVEQPAHRGLELDGAAHGYTADEWLPLVYEIAAEHLSRALVALDQETPEATAALAASSVACSPSACSRL
jgi:hypothetical protein